MAHQHVRRGSVNDAASLNQTEWRWGWRRFVVVFPVAGFANGFQTERWRFAQTQAGPLWCGRTHLFAVEGPFHGQVALTSLLEVERVLEGGESRRDFFNFFVAQIQQEKLILCLPTPHSDRIIQKAHPLPCFSMCLTATLPLPDFTLNFLPLPPPQKLCRFLSKEASEQINPLATANAKNSKNWKKTQNFELKFGTLTSSNVGVFSSSNVGVESGIRLSNGFCDCWNKLICTSIELLLLLLKLLWPLL